MGQETKAPAVLGQVEDAALGQQVEPGHGQQAIQTAAQADLQGAFADADLEDFLEGLLLFLVQSDAGLVLLAPGNVPGHGHHEGATIGPHQAQTDFHGQPQAVAPPEAGFLHPDAPGRKLIRPVLPGFDGREKFGEIVASQGEQFLAAHVEHFMGQFVGFHHPAAFQLHHQDRVVDLIHDAALEQPVFHRFETVAGDVQVPLQAFDGLLEHVHVLFLEGLDDIVTGEQAHQGTFLVHHHQAAYLVPFHALDGHHQQLRAPHRMQGLAHDLAEADAVRIDAVPGKADDVPLGEHPHRLPAPGHDDAADVALRHAPGGGAQAVLLREHDDPPGHGIGDGLGLDELFHADGAQQIPFRDQAQELACPIHGHQVAGAPGRHELVGPVLVRAEPVHQDGFAHVQADGRLFLPLAPGHEFDIVVLGEDAHGPSLHGHHQAADPVFRHAAQDLAQRGVRRRGEHRGIQYLAQGDAGGPRH